MSQSFHNAAIQAQATRDAARTHAAASLSAVRYQEHVRKNEAEKLEQAIKDFANFDESSLFRKSDKQLAEFQAGYPTTSPQYSLALHEWNRRLVTRQVNATKFAAVIGLIGVIIGSILGWLLSSYSFKHSQQQFVDYISKTQVEAQTGHQTSDNLQGDDPKEIAPDSLE